MLFYAPEISKILVLIQFSFALLRCISLTDMVKSFGDDNIISNWLRNRNTLEFIRIWEPLNNPDFNTLEFEGFKNQAGLNKFWISPKKWIETTRAIGMISKAGKYGLGTYGHKINTCP